MIPKTLVTFRKEVTSCARWSYRQRELERIFDIRTGRASFGGSQTSVCGFDPHRGH